MNSEAKPKKSIAVTVRLSTEIVDEIDAKSDDRAEFIRNIIIEARRNDYKVSPTEINKEIGEIKPFIEGATAEFKGDQIIPVAKEVNQNTYAANANVETALFETAAPQQVNELQNLKDNIVILNNKIDMLTNNQTIMTQYMTTMQQLLQQKKIAGEVDDVKKPWWKFW
ncbi:MAG TPA: hypothetical protein VN368_03110 [Candidatus Methylomirabilis sp.]|nr:hypothetical protein [Candidatus Methylomirabilis sp.]